MAHLNEEEDIYMSPDEDEELSTPLTSSLFNIYDYKIDKKDDKTFLIKLSFRDLLRYSVNWYHNRALNIEKVDELYNTLIEDTYSIPWTLHAVYDEKYVDRIKKILILDGQHRKQSIEKYITNHDMTMTCDKCVWVWIYVIEKTETSNSNCVIDIFRKINNNRLFNESELPSTFIIDLIKKICDNKTLKKGISLKDTVNKCHTPYIHRKELNTILNEKKELLLKYTIEELIDKFILINHKLSLKSYEDLYGQDDDIYIKKYKKANTINFYLNLGKNSKYPIDIWITHINNIDLL